MIVLDSSALLAIALGEADAHVYVEVIDNSVEILFSSVNYAESFIVVQSRLKNIGVRDLQYIITQAGIQVESADEEMAKAAYETYIMYGKGRHPAGLNICDCFAYALAKAYDAPLLFKGDDFKKTNIVSAL